MSTTDCGTSGVEITPRNALKGDQIDFLVGTTVHAFAVRANTVFHRAELLRWIEVCGAQPRVRRRAGRNASRRRSVANQLSPRSDPSQPEWCVARSSSSSIPRGEIVIGLHRRASGCVGLEEPVSPGRLTVPADVRTLIRTMAPVNTRWGAPRMHGDLLKLWIGVRQATVDTIIGRIHAGGFRLLTDRASLRTMYRARTHCPTSLPCSRP
jgi:hypothetical protein